jgi:AcrR family transcriptional regulator
MDEPIAPEAPDPRGAEPSRRSRKKERTRRAIYDAALALFAERGFDGVTLEDICRRADVARATFFLHFPTKGALLFEAVAGLTDDLREQLAEPLPTAREELQRVTRWVLERWAASREVMEPMFREVLSAPAAQLHARPEAMEFAGLIVDIVRRGQARGELRRDILPEIAATSFVASCFTIVSVLVRQDPRANIAPFIEQYLDLLLHGLTAPAPG